MICLSYSTTAPNISTHLLSSLLIFQLDWACSFVKYVSRSKVKTYKLSNKLWQMISWVWWFNHVFCSMVKDHLIRKASPKHPSKENSKYSKHCSFYGHCDNFIVNLTRLYFPFIQLNIDLSVVVKGFCRCSSSPWWAEFKRNYPEYSG